MINNFVEHFQLSSVWKRNGDLDGMEEKFEKLGNCLILSPVSTLARGFRIIFNVKSRIRRICRICYSFIHCSFSCEHFLRRNPFFFFSFWKIQNKISKFFQIPVIKILNFYSNIFHIRDFKNLKNLEIQIYKFFLEKKKNPFGFGEFRKNFRVRRSRNYSIFTDHSPSIVINVNLLKKKKTF